MADRSPEAAKMTEPNCGEVRPHAAHDWTGTPSLRITHCPGRAANTRFDPDRPCLHPDFAVFADVTRIVRSGEPETDDTAAFAFAASLRVECAVCGEKFRWIGVEAGDMPSRPMCSVDEFELRAPLRPASADPDFGLGMPGYAVRYREPRNAD